jgi:hypothetical protein
MPALLAELCAVDIRRRPDDAGAKGAASTSGALRYGHFEIVVVEDGSPVELGSGAMGVTYRARDTVLGSEVALKVIDQRLADDANARARFAREARAGVRIVGQPLVDDLQRDFGAEHRVARAVGDTHCTRAELDGRTIFHDDDLKVAVTQSPAC